MHTHICRLTHSHACTPKHASMHTQACTTQTCTHQHTTTSDGTITHPHAWTHAHMPTHVHTLIIVYNIYLFCLVSASFSCTLKFVVKDCDPNTGEPDDDEGYEDEYVVRSSSLYSSNIFVYDLSVKNWPPVGDKKRAKLIQKTSQTDPKTSQTDSS